MKFHSFRCLGILAIGVAAFFLAVMQGTYSWGSFFGYLFSPSYQHIFYGFILGLIVAAISLSIEET